MADFTFKIEKLDEKMEEFMQNIAAFKDIQRLTIKYIPVKPKNQQNFENTDLIMKYCAEIIKACPKLK